MVGVLQDSCFIPVNKISASGNQRTLLLLRKVIYTYPLADPLLSG